MLLVFVVFVVGTGMVLGAYAVATHWFGRSAERQFEQRLLDVSAPIEATPDDTTVVKHTAEGPLPLVTRLMSNTSAGGWLTRTIEQSGIRTTPGGLVAMSLLLAFIAALAAQVLTHVWLAVPVAAVIGGIVPIAFVCNRRAARMSQFEEQFPEGLDLMARALRAGHAFQTALGMAGDELKAPVGPEFRKTFEQQNYGLPLREALMQLSERVPNMDVRFFVTAVLIQRETGGNLSEILDNLSNVVRERFKIRRQIRVHTAHGRFTGFVLLALPAFLGLALSLINPEHMNTLFRERVGQTLLIATIVLETAGFVWIRQVIKIEV